MDDYRSARAWKRIVAFLLDLYFSLVVTWSFFTLLRAEIPSSAQVLSASYVLSPYAAILVVYAAIFLLLYHVACEYIAGATPGMLLLGLRAQRRPDKTLARSSQDLSFGQALVRNLFIMPVLPFSLLWLIEPLYYLFQGERLLEHLSRTETVE